MPSTLYLYTVDTTPLQNEELFSELYSSVSQYRREKTDRLRFPKDKQLSLGAEYLFMCGCHDFGIEYRNECICQDSFSKPKFSNSPVYFNLSHSGNKAMCIMSFAQVGCDVEKVRHTDLHLAKRFFCEEEYTLLQVCPTQQERDELFFRFWTVKESFMKCTGLGLSLPPNAFCVHFTENGIDLTHSVDPATYSAFEMKENDGYRYAWCVRNPENEREEYNTVICRKTIEI